MINVKRKNYFIECLKGVILAFVGTILCSLGFGVGQNLEERQWLGAFDWYGFLCIAIGGVFGQLLQFVLIAEIFNIG